MYSTFNLVKERLHNAKKDVKKKTRAEYNKMILLVLKKGIVKCKK